MLKLRKIKLQEVEEITAIQKRTFDEDSITHSPEHKADGPPGYDEPASVQENLFHMDGYTILSDNRIIGAVFTSLSSTAVLWIHRIFLIPEFQGKGLGKTVFRILQKAYPQAKAMALDTPAWHRKNQRFYEGLGFEKTGEESSPYQDFILYQYRLDLQKAAD